MADFAALILGQGQNVFLSEQDLIAVRQQADEIDAAYGESLDMLSLDAFARLATRSYAA